MNARDHATSRASGRLPAAPGERRPLLAALAVLLIVGGALVAGLVATRMDQRTEVLMVAQTVKAGAPIALENLAVTPVAATTGGLIPASQIEAVVGKIAKVELSEGEFVQATQVAENSPVTEGTSVVGLSLALGKFPAGGVNPGDVVTLVNVKDGTTAVKSAQVLEAVPTSGNEQGWTSGATVSLLVSSPEAAKVARLGAEEAVAVVVTATGHPIGEF